MGNGNLPTDGGWAGRLKFYGAYIPIVPIACRTLCFTLCSQLLLCKRKPECRVYRIIVNDNSSNTNNIRSNYSDNSSEKMVNKKHI